MKKYRIKTGFPSFWGCFFLLLALSCNEKCSEQAFSLEQVQSNIPIAYYLNEGERYVPLANPKQVSSHLEKVLNSSLFRKEKVKVIGTFYTSKFDKESMEKNHFLQADLDAGGMAQFSLSQKQASLSFVGEQLTFLYLKKARVEGCVSVNCKVCGLSPQGLCTCDQDTNGFCNHFLIRENADEPSGHSISESR